MIAKIILLGLLTLSLGFGMAKHGEKRTSQNGWASLISFIIVISLLYWAGFFNSF